MFRPHYNRRLALATLVIANAVLCIGCRCQEKKRAIWSPPLPIAPISEDCNQEMIVSESLSELAFAESSYAQAMQLDNLGAAECVDYYFQTLQNVWPIIERQLLENNFPRGRAGDLYRSASNKLITAGQKTGRFDPRSGLQIQTNRGWQTIATSYLGFPWKPGEFNQVVPVGNYSTKDLIEYFRYPGVGVSTVVIRDRTPEDHFIRKQQYFPATMLVRPNAEANGQFEIQFINPIQYSKIDIDGQSFPLKRDTSAPIAYRLKDEGDQWLTAFLQPGSTKNTTGLFMIQPYQPGKIPLVFVHGLLSDPLTWANIANEMFVRPDLMDKYQIWVFEYATGEPFLRSAAVLRQHLQQAMAQIDPLSQDPALAQTVLVGHSMGGLVAKLQVTYSGDELWQAVSRCPFDQIRMQPDLANRLASSFYFNPSPKVARVIYIATPHDGSPWANRPIGKLGSILVEEPPSQVSEHQQLIAKNPGNFSREFRKRIPTSIDLLRPNSPLLKAISHLETRPAVEFHSIIGIWRPMIGALVSDSVVPTRSAIIPDVATQKFIHAKHEKINKTPACINELFCILRDHSQAIKPYDLQRETVPETAPPEAPLELQERSKEPGFTVRPIIENSAAAFREPDTDSMVLPAKAPLR